MITVEDWGDAFETGNWSNAHILSDGQFQVENREARQEQHGKVRNQECSYKENRNKRRPSPS